MPFVPAVVDVLRFLRGDVAPSISGIITSSRIASGRASAASRGRDAGVLPGWVRRLTRRAGSVLE